MEFKDMLELAKISVKADPKAPVAYSFGEEKYSLEQVNKTLQNEFAALLGNGDNRYRAFQENKNCIFRLIEETIDEVLPQRVEQRYMDFAEVKTIAQGDRATFVLKITEAARKRAKTFVTRVGLAGRYETFMLDGRSLDVKTSAIGGAARIGFEEVLDGRWSFADMVELTLEGMDEYIVKEIAKALKSAVDTLPAVQQHAAAGFDEVAFDELLAIADAYGKSTIYCTFEFAAQMKPVEAWASNEHKNAMWNRGMIDSYKGHTIVLLPQSFEDERNLTKVFDPSYCYIMPTGQDNRPVKLVFEGPTCVRTVDNQNDDWSMDMQTYKKFGIATFFNNWMCCYRNTGLKMESRSAQMVPVPTPPEPDNSVNAGDFETLNDAIAAVPNGGTVVLASDTSAQIVVANGKEIAIDLNGKTLTAEGASALEVTSGFVTLNNGTVAVKGADTIKLDTRVSGGQVELNVGEDVVLTSDTDCCVYVP